MPIRFADLCPRDLLMLVTRYHGVWIIVPAFTETPVIADVIVTFARSSTMSSVWTTAVTTTLQHARGSTADRRLYPFDTARLLVCSTVRSDG